MRKNDLKLFLKYLFLKIKDDFKTSIEGFSKVSAWEKTFFNLAIVTFFLNLWYGKRDVTLILGFLVLWLIAMLYNEYKSGNWKNLKKGGENGD